MFAIVNSEGFLVSTLALLLVVVRRMFSPEVYLEVRRCGALEVAVSARKRLLPVVPSQVMF